MKKEIEKKIKKFLSLIKARKDRRIKFIFLFGSALRSDFNPLSDIDIAIYYDADRKTRFKFLINFLGAIAKGYDVHIFQDLPSYVRKEILKGQLIYCTDFSLMHEKAYATLKEWSLFKKNYHLYISRPGIAIKVQND